VCFTEKELKIIGELATKYDVPVIEDLAYFCMDFRKDYSKPGVPPFQPTVANYTDKYILLISGAKAFSYAGQRIALMVVSNALFKTRAPDLRRYFISDQVGKSVIYGAIYSLSAGVSQSAQLGFAAIMKAANEGKLDFVKPIREYGEKAKTMKKIFTDNGFKIVYDNDDGEPIADGFYFTLSYPGFTGEELVEELLYYGVSAIALSTTGSSRAGIRACVSLVKREEFSILEERVKRFTKDHS
jgi:aspartate/methionine/tyrosine aminotransferase